MNSKRKRDSTNGEQPALPPSGQTEVATAVPPRPPGSQLGPELPHVVLPSAVYTVEDLRRVFGLKASSVRREVRLGRLRIAKRCGRYYCLGQWVQQWIENGELKRCHGREEADARGVGRDGQST